MIQLQADMGTDLCKVLAAGWVTAGWILLWDSRTSQAYRLNNICCKALAKAQTGRFECCRESPPTCAIALHGGILGDSIVRVSHPYAAGDAGASGKVLKG